MKDNKSIKKVKKLLKNAQVTIECGLKKQLTVYDKIDNVKERKKSKETFLVAYRSIFNDSINAVIKDVMMNKKFIVKMKELELSVFKIAVRSATHKDLIQAAIDGYAETPDDVKEKIAKVLKCKIEDIFD